MCKKQKHNRSRNIIGIVPNWEEQHREGVIRWRRAHKATHKLSGDAGCFIIIQI